MWEKYMAVHRVVWVGSVLTERTLKYENRLLHNITVVAFLSNGKSTNTYTQPKWDELCMAWKSRLDVKSQFEYKCDIRRRSNVVVLGYA